MFSPGSTSCSSLQHLHTLALKPLQIILQRLLLHFFLVQPPSQTFKNTSCNLQKASLQFEIFCLGPQKCFFLNLPKLLFQHPKRPDPIVTSKNGSLAPASNVFCEGLASSQFSLRIFICQPLDVTTLSLKITFCMKSALSIAAFDFLLRQCTESCTPCRV